jgi:site-specific DNA recombinase
VQHLKALPILHQYRSTKGTGSADGRGSTRPGCQQRRREYFVRVEVQLDQLVIQLAEPPITLEVPWRKTPARRRREILLPEGIRPEQARPIRSETRARLVASIIRGRRWLDELIADPTASAYSVAKRENCTTRKINMTISLAFLAPDLVKAAIDGRLPHGMGVARLTDLLAEWCRQHRMLGLPAQ